MNIPDLIAAELRSTRVGFNTPVTEDTHLHDDLRCCPIDLTCIQMEIEMQGGFELSSFEVERCQTVGDLCRLVERVKGRLAA